MRSLPVLRRDRLPGGLRRHPQRAAAGRAGDGVGRRPRVRADARARRGRRPASTRSSSRCTRIPTARSPTAPRACGSTTCRRCSAPARRARPRGARRRRRRDDRRASGARAACSTSSSPALTRAARRASARRSIARSSSCSRAAARWSSPGIGKSGLVGRKIAATFASTGTPAFFLHAGEGEPRRPRHARARRRRARAVVQRRDRGAPAPAAARAAPRRPAHRAHRRAGVDARRAPPTSSLDVSVPRRRARSAWRRRRARRRRWRSATRSRWRCSRSAASRPRTSRCSIPAARSAAGSLRVEDLMHRDDALPRRAASGASLEDTHRARSAASGSA